MDWVLDYYPAYNVCVIGYIDNILIYSDSLDEHKDHVWDILQ